MSIPKSQLETWSHQGSIQQSSATYNAVKNVLEAPDTPYATRDFKVFLQGSYGNDTNIWAESHVDVVIKLDDCWQSGLSSLSEGEKAAYNAAYINATYGRVEFKRDVLKVLTDEYGSDVTDGDKAIAIARNGNRRKADVIVALQFRRYFKFNGLFDQSYTEGICFWNRAGERIANYPKLHAANLTAKHQATSAWLKPMVRVFKNLRGHLVSEGLLEQGCAPSYYLEGLLYNVPTDGFGASYEDCFVNSINWLNREANKNELVCANEQYYLLRDGHHTCWPTANGAAFLDAAVKRWNTW